MDFDNLVIGTMLVNPRNIDYPYDEYALRMDLPGDRAWFIVNTKHGGAYTDGNELRNWTLLYTPPTLIEE